MGVGWGWGCLIGSLAKPLCKFSPLPQQSIINYTVNAMDDNLTIAPVPAKQPWWIWIKTSCEFIMNDCITSTKQSTTKPCAYFLEYTVPGTHAVSHPAWTLAMWSWASVVFCDVIVIHAEFVNIEDIFNVCVDMFLIIKNNTELHRIQIRLKQYQ